MVCMNVSRPLAGFLFSSPIKKWGLLYSASALCPIPFPCGHVVRAYGRSLKTPATAWEDLSLEQPKKYSEIPRPSLIAFQAKVANLVRLVGTIDSGVMLQQFPEGTYASVTIVVNENAEKLEHFSPFSIPIIFRGDLAEVAACHLKKNDLIYVSGQLTGDNLPFIQKDAKENIKLIADSLNFVKEASPRNRGQFIQEDGVSSSYSGVKKISDNVSKGSWDELFVDPTKWMDNREGKLKGSLSIKYPDFVHMETRVPLWLNTAPSWVFPRLDGLVFGSIVDVEKLSKKNSDKDVKKISDNVSKCPWDELFVDPSKWMDSREGKLKGSLSIKHPDFVHMETRAALWLNTAPSWVFPRLEGLVFGSIVDVEQLSKKNSDKENQWKRFLENPDEWWDNRLKKIKENHPDFKNKYDGEALWLNAAPSWVLAKLPPLPDIKQ